MLDAKPAVPERMPKPKMGQVKTKKVFDTNRTPKYVHRGLATKVRKQPTGYPGCSQ